MHGVRSFDYSDLYNFLREKPRTLAEMKHRYGNEANRCYTIITNATFMMPVYEETVGSKTYYGIAEGDFGKFKIEI